MLECACPYTTSRNMCHDTVPMISATAAEKRNDKKKLQEEKPELCEKCALQMITN